VAEAVEFVHKYTARHTDSNGLLPGQMGYLGGDEVLPTSQALAEEAQRRWIAKYQNQPVRKGTRLVFGPSPLQQEQRESRLNWN
jgi:hypothetical protein